MFSFLIHSPCVGSYDFLNCAFLSVRRHGPTLPHNRARARIIPVDDFSYDTTSTSTTLDRPPAFCAKNGSSYHHLYLVLYIPLP
jgi:hypothetical protein